MGETEYPTEVLVLHFRREKGDLRRELKKLAKEERQRQQQAVTDVIKESTVILTTLTGALSFQLKGTDFDLVVLDEAAQALECACWIPILKVSRSEGVGLDGLLNAWK